ncbi:MAG: acyltransferase [Prolixibacteraceae bacterium]|jgi:acetyltransferase-like isoleucine patch superfamily enzyme
MIKYIKTVFDFVHLFISGYNHLIAQIQFFVFSVNISNNWSVNGRIFIRNNGKITIGTNLKANSSKFANPIGGDTILRIIIGESAILEIGNNVGISNSTIICKKNIVIGDNVLIGGSCKIWDTDFHSLDSKKWRTKNDIPNNLPIKIENDVFIGSGTFILKGVTIGEGAIIGAGSVVTRNVPPFEIWAGNPASFIKKILPKN